MIARELPVRTFAQPDALVIEVTRLKHKWHVTTAEGRAPAFVYEDREYVDGHGLALMGELHVVDGKKYLIKYDQETVAEREDYWEPRDKDWYMPELTDKDVEEFNRRLRRQRILKEDMELKKMIGLMKRLKAGKEGALEELLSLSPETIEEFREKVRELDLSVDYLVWTTPRALRRMKKFLKAGKEEKG